ncbi:MAG: hypothetical protein RIA09_16215 [Hoeflea sp.]|jgi:hypothetical protein
MSKNETKTVVGSLVHEIERILANTEAVTVLIRRDSLQQIHGQLKRIKGA